MKNSTLLRQKHHTSLFLGEATVFTDVVPQVTSREIVHYQVEIFSILESVIHVDNEGVIELCEYLPFIHNTFETAFREYARLGHFLHGVLLLSLFSLDLPDLSEAALPDAILISEGTLS